MSRFLLTFLLATTASASAQSPLAEAEAALQRGQAWRTTQLLAPLLATPATRTPDAVILGAEAAAAWQGWSTVTKLLAREPWLDARYDRLGRRLLAEAALGEGRARDAVNHATLAVANNSNSRAAGEQGRRLLLLARAYDRLNRLDSAATLYTQAGQRFPELQDWFALRAAGVEGDSGRRARSYAALSLPAAATRVGRTEALARERTGDIEGAIAAHLRLGARATALRLRWQRATTPAARAAVAEDLLAVAQSTGSIAASREALVLIDQLSVPLRREQQLAVARRAATLGRAAQAVAQYTSASRTGQLSSADRFRYGNALGTLNRWPEAAAQYKGVTDPELAGHAAYYAARAQLRTGDANASTSLRAVVRDFPRDTVAAGTALYLLGDLAIDAGLTDSARTLFRQLVSRYPSSPHRPRSLILAALIALEGGDAVTAVRELEDAIAGGTPNGVHGDAIRYWRGRSLLAAGARPEGQAALRELLDLGPESYYALRAAARLDTLPWSVELPEPVPADSAMQAVFRRAALLDSLGMQTEAGFELEHLMASATDAVAMVRVADGLGQAGYPNRSVQVAERALAAGAPRDATLWALLYPLPFETRLRETAMSERVDPLLAASIIRQESRFEPRATSGPGARGLMQVMPANTQSLGRAFGFADFDPALLWVAEVNLAFGMRHLAGGLGRYPEVERALAAYNAGGSPVDRWSLATLEGRIGADRARAPLTDAEIFVERIPFDETRNYVRVVLRNLAMYRMLYGR
jgi:soluble lytic murein transglycosylase